MASIAAMVLLPQMATGKSGDKDANDAGGDNDTNGGNGDNCDRR